MIIKKGIHKLQVPMRRNPLSKTYSYLLEESRTLIDTGVGTEDAYLGLKQELKTVNLEPQDIERIIVTHLHHDHIGLTKRFRDDGTLILASRQAAEQEEWLQNIRNHFYEYTAKELELFGVTQHLNHLRKYKYAFRETHYPFEIDVKLEDEQTIDLPGIKLKVYWTPGHAPGHICLFDSERKTLFSGDHILPKITSHVSLHTYRAADPLNDYLNSLEKLKDLDANIILPGHDQIFFDLKGRIKELYEHHRNRLGEIKEILMGSSKTVFDVGSRVHWDSRPWLQMSFWTKRMAAAETYAHLVYLKNRGEVIEKRNKELKYSLI